MPLLSVRDLVGRQIREVSIDVAAGEIVGVAGLAGSGRSELLRIVAGVQRAAPAASRCTGTSCASAIRGMPSVATSSTFRRIVGTQG